MPMERIYVFDFEKAYENSLDPMIIPCNTDLLKTKKQAAEFIQYLFTESGNINNILTATCGCGKSSGRYLAGSICPKCDGMVQDVISQELGFSAWIELPEFLPPLLNPLVYHTLNNWLPKGVLNQLLEPDINLELLPAPLAGLGGSGPMFFYNNFDMIIKYLVEKYKPVMKETPGRKGKPMNVNATTVAMLTYLKLNKKALFTKHFPVLDKNLHVLTDKGSSRRDADSASEYILKVTTEVSTANLLHTLDPMDTITLDRTAMDITIAYASYANAILDTKLLQKKGLIRRHILGSRCHFSVRAVIAPISDLTPFDELQISWSIAIRQYKLQIMNHLINRHHYSLRGAMQRHQAAIENFDEVIYSIMNTLIAESPYKGLPCLLGRNPTLHVGGIQMLYITKVKPDLSDDCISVSQNIMAAPNADCDGDCLYMTQLLENEEVEYFKGFHPSVTLLTNETLGISNTVSIGAQARVCLNSFLREDRDHADLECV